MLKFIQREATMRKKYYLIKERSNRSKRPIYYFKVEDPRYPGKYIKRSTHETSKKDAIKYTEDFLNKPDAYESLFSKHKPTEAIRIENGSMLFKDYAANWWDWDKCEYVMARRRRSTANHPRIKRSYTEPALIRKKKYIIPYFGDMELTSIKETHVESFFSWLISKKLSMKTINDIRSNLNIMMNWAVKNDLIKKNPVALTLKFPVERTKRKLLTSYEARMLFATTSINEIWDANSICYTASFLSFLTGMRQGEILALKPCDLFHCHFDDERKDRYLIHVKSNYSDRYGLSTTKNSESRDVPIPRDMYKMLLKLASCHETPKGYIFSESGKTPINSRIIRHYFCKALRKIGIADEMRKARNLTFHSLRSAFVTNNRMHGIPDTKIAAISGHKTLNVLNTYTNYGDDNFRDIDFLQEQIEEAITKT